MTPWFWPIALAVSAALAGCGTSSDCDGDIEFQVSNTTMTVFDVTFDLGGCSGSGVLIEGPGSYTTWLKQSADLKPGDLVKVKAVPRGAGAALEISCHAASDVAPTQGKDYVRVDVDGNGQLACDCHTAEYMGGPCL